MPAERSGGLARRNKPDWKVEIAGYWEEFIAVTHRSPKHLVDVCADKLAFAQRFGATHVINTKESEPVGAIRDLTNGGVDYAIDTIGLPANPGANLARHKMGFPGFDRGGTALLIGITPPGAHAILYTTCSSAAGISPVQAAETAGRIATSRCSSAGTEKAN